MIKALSARRHDFFGGLLCSVNLLLVLSLMTVLYGVAWDYTLRCYLSGFADAMTPLRGSPEQKVESILAWMKAPPVRDTGRVAGFLVDREPDEILTHEELLRVCASAANVLINLATNRGIEARRLLLLNEQGQAKHVVAEVHLSGRWVVVDPRYGILRGSQGQPLSKEELRNPAIFSETTREIRGYPPDWTYDRTVHVRLQRLPYLGGLLRKGLDRLFPRWDEAFNWSWALVRRSITLTVLGLFLFCMGFLARLTLHWYDPKRTGISSARSRSRQLGAHGSIRKPCRT